MRSNPLAQKIADENVRLGLTQTFYSPINFNSVSGQSLGRRTDIFDASTSSTINGETETVSQRCEDTVSPRFDAPVHLVLTRGPF